jgi:hypothetical protein
MHVVLCQSYDLLYSPIQVFASAADLINAVAYSGGDIGSQFLSSFGRKEQSGHSTDAYPQNKCEDCSWCIAS